MKLRQYLKALVITSMLSVHSAPVMADNGGGLAAIFLACLVLCGGGRQQPRRAAPQMSGAQRAENKEIQTALNTFGFEAGAVDGQLGGGTREAIKRYQITVNGSPDGAMTDNQKQFLLDAYHESTTNPPAIQQMAANNPRGWQGVPAALRDQRAGVTPTLAPQPVVQPVPPQPIAPATLPTFPVLPGPEKSMNEQCNQITTLTATNGGFQTSAAMTDASLALNEMFCLDRTLAVAEGSKSSKSMSVSQDQITQVCQGSKAFLADQVAALGTKPAAQSLATAKAVVDGQHKSAAETVLTGKICLGEGYRTDDAKMALAAALTLSAAGQKPYSELIGHQLREGFGVTANQDAGKDWMNVAVTSLKEGDTPVFMVDQATDRLALMTVALRAAN